MRNTDGTAGGTYISGDVPIFSGGWEVTTDAVGDHVASGGDVYGIWFCDSSMADTDKKDMLKARYLPQAILDELPGRGTITPSNSESGIGSMGAYALRIAPSDNNFVWAVIEGWLCYKTDWTGPLRWVKTGLAAQKSLSNQGAQRLWNYKIAVDPANKDVVIVGYEENGARYTEDRGVTNGKVNGSDHYQIVEWTGIRIVAKAAAQAAFTLTVNAASGSGSVAVSGNAVTVTPAAGAASGSQIAAQLNANGTFSASYEAQATFAGEGGGAGNAVATVSGYGSDSVYPILVAFDPTSAVTSGKTQGVYYAVYGKGIYKGTAGVSGSFALMAGSPKDARSLFVDSAGNIWVIRNGNYAPNLMRYKGGAWAPVVNPSDTTGTNKESAIVSLCFDPADNNRMFAMWTDSDMVMTLNALATTPTWLGPWMRGQTPPHRTFVANDSPWLKFAHGPEGLGGTGCLAFDTVNQRLYCAHGIGLAYMSPIPSTFVQTHWYSRNNGSRMIVSYRILSIPGRPAPLFMGGDRMCFQVSDLTKTPNDYGPDRNLNEGMDVDYAGNNPDFVAVSVQNFGNFSGDLQNAKHSYSLQAGKPGTWVNYAVMPNSSDNPGGCCAVSTDQDQIFIGSQGGWPRRTRNRGASWADVAFTATGTALSVNGFCPAALYFARRHIVDADKTLSNVYYIYYDAGTADLANQGLWKLGDTGPAVKISSGALAYAANYFHAKLRCIPGVTREMLFTAGDIGGGNPAPSELRHIVDNNNGTCTITTVAGFYEVKDFGFGKKLVASDPYPTVLIAGWYNGGSGSTYTYGYWRIDRYKTVNQTVTKIADYANDHADFITCANGDLNEYGTMYVGYQGSGYDWMRLRHRIPLTI